MDKRRIRELSNIQIDEVSLVDIGANQHADIVISKRGEQWLQNGYFSKMDPTPDGLTIQQPLGNRKKSKKVGVGPRMNKDEVETYGKASCSGCDDAECYECNQDGGLKQDISASDLDDDSTGSPASAPVADKGSTVGGWKTGSNKKVKKGFWSGLVEKMLTDDEFTTPSTPDVTLGYVDGVEKHFPGQPDPQSQFGQPAPAPHPAGAGAPMPHPGAGAAQPHPSAVTPPFQHPGLAAPAPTGAPVGAVPPVQPGAMPAGPLAQPQPQMAQLPPEVVNYIKQLEQMVAQLQGGDDGSNQPATNSEDPSNGSDNNGGKKMSGFGKSESYDPDEREFLVNLAKSLDSEEQGEAISKALELVEKAESRAKDAENIAKAERDIRVTQEWVAKAGKYDVPVAPLELGPVLKRANESLSEEDFAVIEKCLGAITAQQGIFAEIGKRGTSNGDVYDEVQQRAAELVSKGVDPMTAQTQVYEQNPGLYDAYLREQAGR